MIGPSVGSFTIISKCKELGCLLRLWSFQWSQHTSKLHYCLPVYHWYLALNQLINEHEQLSNSALALSLSEYLPGAQWCVSTEETVDW